MQGVGKSKAPVPSGSVPGLSGTVASSSAANASPEVMTIHSVPNRKIGYSSPLSSLTNLSETVVSGREGVGIVPPPIAAVRVVNPNPLIGFNTL